MSNKVSPLGIIPLNFMSFLLGVLVRVRLPKPFSWFINGAFVTAFRIDMEEAEKPMVDYPTVEDIFTRGLREGARAIEGSFVSPADGVLSEMGPAEAGEAVQAKGLTYSLEQLSFGSFPVPSQHSLTSFATIYLAPHNYHRVHSPCGGIIRKVRYLPGELWPVNQPFVKFLPKLFVRNERLVFDIELPNSGGWIHAVMVGALNVGRIKSPLLEKFFSNDYFSKSQDPFERTLDFAIQAGEEIGTFMLGSTVVLALDSEASKTFKLSSLSEKTPVRMGRNLLNITKG